MAAPGAQQNADKAQLLLSIQRSIGKQGFPNTLSHPLHHMKDLLRAEVPIQEIPHLSFRLRLPLHHGQILLAEFACRDGGREGSGGFGGFGIDHQSGGLPVQAVDAEDFPTAGFLA